MSKRIGVVTGGGDCPGLNAVISSLVRAGLNNGDEFIGFKKGFEGLLGEGDYQELTIESIRGIAHLGGTILQTTNHGHFAAKVADGQLRQIEPELLDQVKATIQRLNLDGLVVIGGDGSLSTAWQFQENGINVVGVPKTIDNDLKATDRTFGFSTAVEIISESLSRIHTTASSHDRVFLVETMGRNVGWLTLFGGIAGGADIILIPEIPFSYDSILNTLNQRRSMQRNYAVIAVAEGASAIGEVQSTQEQRSGAENLLGGVAYHVAEKIKQRSGDQFDVKVMVLGHLQRGGSPNAEDRILAQQFGFAAFEAVRNGDWGKMVCSVGDQIQLASLAEAVDSLKKVGPDSQVVKMARGIGINFGD